MQDNVRGVTIPFLELPKQTRQPFPYRLRPEEQPLVQAEIDKFLENGVIKEAQHEVGEFISNIFVRPKPDGEARIILDLTELNKKVQYQHFKMFSLSTAVDLVTPGAFMASVDLRHAYYTIPIKIEHRKYLRFTWKGKLYEYTCLPNGLSACPRIFTMLLKPIYAKLIELGYVVFPYIDDSFIIADTKDECGEAVQAVCSEFQDAGFTIHEKKSVLVPSTKIKFLGFWIDSVRMEVSLTKEKINKFRSFAEALLAPPRKKKIRKVAVLLGLMTAYSQGLQYGSAHIKSLEIDKNVALRKARGNFENQMVISEHGLQDITWWIKNVDGAHKVIKIEDSTVELTTDASLEGWGAHEADLATGGRWLKEEIGEHINVLELKAILLGLKSLVTSVDKKVNVRTDNTTALAYVRRMGGTKSVRCNQITKLIWDWAEERGVWIEITHIPGKDNVLADAKSRKFNDHLEWSLSDRIFAHICEMWGTPEIDLFASRGNRKLERYVSWNPEPESWAIDAFTFKWNNNFYYVFPPFSLVGRVARKLMLDKADAILITPQWKTQPWYAAAKNWATNHIIFNRAKGNLQFSGPLKPEGNVSSTPLVAFRFCGNTCHSMG